MHFLALAAVTVFPGMVNYINFNIVPINVINFNIDPINFRSNNYIIIPINVDLREVVLLASAIAAHYYEIVLTFYPTLLRSKLDCLKLKGVNLTLKYIFTAQTISRSKERP